MIENLIYKVLGTLIAIAGAAALIGGFTWIALSIWKVIFGFFM